MAVAQRNYHEWLSLTYPVTLSTCPALSLPLGLDDQGLPFGVQLIAALGQDARLLAMGQAVERWWQGQADRGRPRPNLAALRTPRPELKDPVPHPPRQPGEWRTEGLNQGLRPAV